MKSLKSGQGSTVQRLCWLLMPFILWDLFTGIVLAITEVIPVINNRALLTLGVMFSYF